MQHCTLHQLISGRGKPRTMVPLATVRGHRAPREDGTLLEIGHIAPRGCTVTHPTLESSVRPPFGESNHTFRAAPVGTSPDFSNYWRIGGANQRKLLCHNDFSLIPGAPDADRVYPEFVWI